MALKYNTEKGYNLCKFIEYFEEVYKKVDVLHHD